MSPAPKILWAAAIKISPSSLTGPGAIVFDNLTVTTAVPELDMGDAASRLRWPWLDGLSSEVKASTDGRLICDHQV
jgi:hypothetical protein